MRITNYHKKPLERQVLESLRIEEGSAVQEESLNLKSEWAASKLPGMKVYLPKGIRKPERKEEKRVRYEQEKEKEGTPKEGSTVEKGTQEVESNLGRKMKRSRTKTEVEEGRKLVIEVRKDIRTREELEKEKLDKERKKNCSQRASLKFNGGRQDIPGLQERVRQKRKEGLPVETSLQHRLESRLRD